MTKTDRKQDTLFVNSLAKGLKLLEAFDEEHQSLGLGELAKRTGLDKSATQRFANTLHQTGYLLKDEATRRFRPSHRFVEMAYAYLWSDPVVQLATPKLIELSGRIGETVNMAELSGSDIVYVARIPCQRTTFAATLVGRRVPALNTSGGRAILSMLPEAERRACVANWPMKRFTPETTQNRERIGELVEEAVRLGYSLSDNELILKEIGVAAPIIGADGRPVAAVHCSASAYHWTHEKVEKDIVPFLLDTANSITPSLR